MDEDICQEVCSKMLDNYKVEMKHMRLGEKMNITIEDMRNSQTTYNSFETLIRCWMDICDCGEFSMKGQFVCSLSTYLFSEFHFQYDLHC